MESLRSYPRQSNHFQFNKDIQNQIYGIQAEKINTISLSEFVILYRDHLHKRYTHTLTIIELRTDVSKKIKVRLILAVSAPRSVVPLSMIINTQSSRSNTHDDQS